MADKFDKVTTSIEKKGVVPPKLPVEEGFVQPKLPVEPKPGKKDAGIVPPTFPAAPNKPGRNPGSGRKK